MSQDFTTLHKEYFYDMPIDFVCIIHPDSKKILQANTSFEYILGWKPEEVIGQTIDSLVQSETDKANIEKAFSKLKLGVHSLTFETEFHTKNNMVRHIDWKCYIDDENHWLYAIGRDITVHIEAQKTLLQQSHLDQLTGMHDRQTFLALLETELHGAVRYHYPTAVILIDIDHFDELNTRYGVQKSDACLKQISAVLKTCLRRKTDFLARFEHSQFVVLLSHNDAEKANKVAEYLRANLQKINTQQNGAEVKIGITISLGVSAIPDTQEKEIKSDQILNAVKQALRVSQQNGGNQVNYANDF